MVLANSPQQKRLAPQLVFGQKNLRLAMTITLVLSLLMTILIVYFYQRLPQEVPLFYSRPWGEEQLVTPWLLFILPGLSLFILFFNFILGGLLFDYPFLVQILIWGSTAFSFLAAFTLIRIISIII
jgi:hypothetical protein